MLGQIRQAKVFGQVLHIQVLGQDPPNANATTGLTDHSVWTEVFGKGPPALSVRTNPKVLRHFLQTRVAWVFQT